ncbi:ERF family protein [Halorhodospira sp. 9621]|uniref:ERF family protein n=1 Tax=Halorhodospira sp. 9621 TaxID=2899135 RepID=UPI001EE90FC8|nr:ERF family protein [Halorhodospira sp. 9621]
MSDSTAIEHNRESVPARSGAPDNGSLVQNIIRAASDPSTDVEKMERLWSMYERIEARNAEAEFNRAMSRCQRQMGRVSADANNPQTRSRYATYARMDAALRPIYTQEGFSLSFDTEAVQDGWVRVLCYVSHETGHTRTYRVDMPSDGIGAKGNAVMTRTHASGSAMSYGMRYLLKLIFNVAIGEDDDDGNAAGNPPRPVAQGSQTVTAEQLAAIEGALRRCPEGTQGRVLKSMKVERLADIPASTVPTVLKRLELTAKHHSQEASQ